MEKKKENAKGEKRVGGGKETGAVATRESVGDSDSRGGGGVGLVGGGAW